MARAFTERHRRLHAKNKHEPDYHGDTCEIVYLHAMDLLAEKNKLQRLISAKRRTRKTALPSDPEKLKDFALNRIYAEKDPRSIAVLSERFKEVSILLKLARMNYSALYSSVRGYTYHQQFYWENLS